MTIAPGAESSIKDSRRLTGPNLLWDRAGAVLDVALDDRDASQLIAEWGTAARRMLDAVGWTGEALHHRRFPGGASLALSAPIDGLLAATEVNEWAWAEAEARVHSAQPPAFEPNLQRLRERIAAERNPRLAGIAAAASERDLIFFADDEFVTVGAGTGSVSWPAGDLPDPSTISWSQLHNRSIALITGCNGKTTTTRLVAAMTEAAGLVTGMTTTDGIQVAGSAVESGDYAGPGGARKVLRDPRVEVAVLETARGGILRRGLAVRHADAAIITNIADDHLGEFGVHDLAALTATKLVVSRVLGPKSPLVLNADDPILVEASRAIASPIIWFSLQPANPLIARHVARGGTAVWLDNDTIVLQRGEQRTPIERLEKIPITMGGAARHNVANVLGAVGVGHGLGVEPAAMARALRHFQGTAADNPGRLNRYELGGVTIIVDFAHNPHGLAALVGTVAALPAKRRLVLLGQAGDRDDQAIRELVRIAWRLRPDRVIAKEMPEYIRGRAVGEIPGLIADELRRLGAAEETIEQAPSELDAVKSALGWARPGDLLLLTIHGQREEVLVLLERLRQLDWGPGRPL